MRSKRLTSVVFGLLFAGQLLLAACGGTSDAEPYEIHLPVPTSVVSLESELIGSPTYIDLDQSGRVWIADVQSRRVLVVNPDGSGARFIGREGQGPGEFRLPVRIAARDSVIRVVDAGNSRIQSYHLDGTHVGDQLLPDPMIGGGALLDNGRIIVPTSGQHDALVRIYSDGRSTPIAIGAPIVPPTGWNFVAMKAEIADGRVPDQFRNTVTPVPSRGGTIWLLVQTEAEVRKYSETGELIWIRTLEVPEVNAAYREFLHRNAAEPDPSVIVPLTTMAAAREVNGRLWVLMRAESESNTAVFYTLDGESGEILGRLSVDVPAAGGQFVVDSEVGVLYLAVPSEASILAIDVTEVLRR